MITNERDRVVRGLEERLKQAIARTESKVLVPEAFSPVVLRAARAYVEEYEGTVILLGDELAIRTCGAEIKWAIDSPSAQILDPMVPKEDLPAIAIDLVQERLVDGMVAGAVFDSSSVLGPAVRQLRVPGAWVSEGVVLVTLEGRVTVFADTAVIRDPDADQLAAIAVGAAGSLKNLTGHDGIVAMLSYSTKASSSDPRVTKVKRAVQIARERVPELVIDGELQFDSAFVPRVAAVKAPTSGVGGRANIFVFPDLASANIGYKIAEHLGLATFFSVFSTGLSRPVINVSRAATPEVFARCLATCALLAGTDKDQNQRRLAESKSLGEA